ncbi:MAG: hypothetical protein ABW168_04200 [Sedimenticola sp.]
MNLNTGNFSKVEILKPSNGALEGFSSMVKPMMESVLSNYHQQEALSSLRESLLPKLLSGELPIKDAQPKLETANMEDVT